MGPEFFDAITEHLPPSEWLFEARALGFPEIYHPYSLRHFVATRLILDGLDEIQVAKFLGTSVEMLQKVYANHIDRDAQRQIGLAVTRLFARDDRGIAREAAAPYVA